MSLYSGEFQFLPGGLRTLCISTELLCLANHAALRLALHHPFRLWFLWVLLSSVIVPVQTSTCPVDRSSARALVLLAYSLAVAQSRAAFQATSGAPPGHKAAPEGLPSGASAGLWASTLDATCTPFLRRSAILVSAVPEACLGPFS